MDEFVIDGAGNVLRRSEVEARREIEEASTGNELPGDRSAVRITEERDSAEALIRIARRRIQRYDGYLADPELPADEVAFWETSRREALGRIRFFEARLEELKDL